VGKSSLVNVAPRERVLVSDMPGTTRDAVDTVLRWHRRTSASLTRPVFGAWRVARSGQVEAVSVLVARRAIERADVAVLVVDAVEALPTRTGDRGEAERTGCGVIVVANKWDLVRGKSPDFAKTFDEELRRQLKFLDYAPLLHISALTGSARRSCSR